MQFAFFTEYQLVKTFAENTNRDFDHMVVDETEYSRRCATNNDILKKFDCCSGRANYRLGPILLKDDKLYLNCEIDSTACVLVIDKHSLKIQSKFALSGWSLLSGVCLDECGDVCVTAWNESNHRILYSFDDGGKVVGCVQLEKFDKYDFVVDMVAADKDFIILTQEGEEVFTLRRLQFKF